MTMKNESIISLFSEYLLREHRSDIYRISLLHSEPYQSVIVHFNNLCEFNSIFSELLLSKPEETLNLLNKSVRLVLQSNKPEDIKHTICRQNVYIRLTALPVIPEVYKNHIPTSNDIGKFIALRAIVSRVGPVQVLEGEAQFTCIQCGYTFTVYANFENLYTIKPPRYCPNRQQSCHSINLKRVSNSHFCAKNYQEIRVHEQFSCLTVGVMRRSMCVCIEDDLLESVKPGDEVVINGIVTRRWRCMKEGAPCEISTFLKANYIENLTELKAGGGPSQISYERVLEFEAYWSKYTNFRSALEARNLLIRSICPEVYGMYLIKLSLALMLASAPEWYSASDDSGTGVDELSVRIRGNPHILLIGDPGTAKSVLLRGCTALCERAVLTAATGTTAAGLTATAIRDSSGWTLDAGALVLADGGLCAIDEFTALHGAHRAAVHEAMEQQTISLAKAGLMARLNCRCSILAAANPTPSSVANGSEDFGLPTPLLSRFDIIWRLVDPIDSTEWDRRIANFVLDLDQPTNDVRNKGTTKHHLWSTNDLKEYFVWIRDRFKPQLTMAAANLLQRYYIWQRSQMSNFFDDTITGVYGRRTLRLLESLVRLTKAHARLMCRNEAIVEDAVVIIYLVDCSLYSTSSIRTNEFNSCITLSNYITPELIVSSNIPENAYFDYTEIEKLVLTTLNNHHHHHQHHQDNVHMKDDVHLNNFMIQLNENTNHIVQVEPLLSSTQLIRNTDKNDDIDSNTIKLYNQKHYKQQFNLSSYKRLYHHLSTNTNNDNIHLISSMNQENIVTPTIPRLKTFKWTALNESVDEKDNNNNNNNNTNNIIGNKPLWNKHLSSQSLDILNDSFKQKNLPGVQCSIVDNYNATISAVNNNNDDDDNNMISFGFNMMTDDENTLKMNLKDEDFEIDL